MSNNEGKTNDKVQYFYGASVQGIQDFIFQTNKLKEIVGASEIVAEICTTAFGELIGKDVHDPGMISDDPNWIVGAAGNVKYIFAEKKDCEKAVLNFPKKVMTIAPGITISQAVVPLKDDLSDYEIQADKLEKLLVSQRNKQVRPMTLGMIAISRSPATGLPAVIEKGGELLDEASLNKISKHNTVRKLSEKSFGIGVLSDKKIAYDIDKLTGKNDWIAVIHADGNGIGNIIRAIGKDKDDMKLFSGMLDNITTKAANEAYKAVEEKFDGSKAIPLRPVVLSGDDMTLICRADLAIDYTKCFIETFEKESQEQFKQFALKKADNQEKINQGLTVCAGIAFVKSSYPFHYSVHLAETLCSRAKRAAKKIDEDLAPSCLMFHKVQDSFIENFDQIASRELIPTDTKLNFEAGPYYCGDRALKVYKDQCQTTLAELIYNVKQLKGTSVRSHLRQWVELLFENVETANQKMKRLRKLDDSVGTFIPEDFEKLNVTDHRIIPYYDMLSFASILHVETKKEDSI